MNRFLKLLGRSLLLRCPVCGMGKQFHGFRMHQNCPHCGVQFEREPGFFLGSIYINYGITSVIVTTAYLVLLLVWRVPKTPLLVGSLVFVVLFPVLLFRHSRSLWLGFDQWHDAQPGETDDQGELPPEK